MNENGRKLIEMCTEKRLSLGNTFFEKKDIRKFIWVRGVNNRESLLGFIVVQEKERDKLLDINLLRFMKRWTGRGVSMEERYEIKLSEVRKVT